MVSVVMQDDYYCDQTHLPLKSALSRITTIRRLSNGHCSCRISRPCATAKRSRCREYDFTLHNRSDRTIPVKPAPVIVIEGLFALYDVDLCDMMSLKIYVDITSDISFIHRMQRDITERGRSVESVVSQYLETVRPMHKQFIEPTKRNADIIIPHGANGPAVDMITTKVASAIDQLKQP